MQAFLLSLQKFFAVNKKWITNIFIVVEVLIMAVWFLIYFQALRDYPSVVEYFFKFGALLGEGALILYVITLTPGIITRLQWWPTLTRPIGAIIMLFRRHFGILMFLTAFWHMTFTTFIPYYAVYDFNPPGLPTLSQYAMMGMVAWLLLFPLWLTSNDLAQQKLGKWWKRLHKLTYISLFFIFLHVAMQESKWMVVMGVYGILEIISWIVFWRRQKMVKAAQASQTPTVPPAVSSESPQQMN